METQHKFCPKCTQTLEASEFCIIAGGKLAGYCKKCSSKMAVAAQRKERQERPIQHYIRSSWSTVNQRCVGGLYSTAPSVVNNDQQLSYKKKGIEIRMSKEEWTAMWLENTENVLAIIAAGDRPSVNRINSDGHYEIGNVEIIPLSVNMKKSKNPTVKQDKLTVKERNRKNYLKSHPAARSNDYRG